MEPKNTRKRKADTLSEPVAKKRKIEIDLANESVKSISSVLPREIMVEMMEYVTDKELRSCALVDKYWSSCSRDVLGWINVGSTTWRVTLKEDYIRSISNSFAKAEEKQVSLCLTIAKKKIDDEWSKEEFNFVDENGTVGAFIASLRALSSWKKKTNEIPFVYEGYRIDYTLVFTPRENCDARIRLDLYLSAKKFQQIVCAGQKFPLTKQVIKQVESEIGQFLTRASKRFGVLDWPVVHNPSTTIATIELKEGKLLEYQMNAIRWMKDIESNLDREYQYCELPRWKRSNTSVLFDLQNKKVVPPQQATTRPIKAKGGVLADDVGLGKTVEVIGLIQSSILEGQLPEYDTNGLFNTKATLIICPNEIAMQWHREVSKFSDLKVSQLVFNDDLKSITYADIINSDVVIMSKGMFKNRVYLSLHGTTKINLGYVGLEKRKGLVAQQLKEMKKKHGRLSTVGPVMEHFHFKRIVVDDAPFVFCDNLVALCIYGLTKTSAWYVSSTPFPSTAHFNCVKKFLEIGIPDAESKVDLWCNRVFKYDQYAEYTTIISNLLWRNTRQSVKLELSTPDKSEDIRWLELHPIEAIAQEWLGSYMHLMPKGNTDTDRLTLDEMKDYLKNDIKSKHRTGWKALGEQLLQRLSKAPYVLKGTKAKGEELQHVRRVNQYGTKTTELMKWIKDTLAESSSNKILLESESDYYLRTLTTQLCKEGIENFVVGGSGNIVHMSKDLQQFQDNTVRVALLNLTNGSTGMTLPANYVVLLDCIDADEGPEKELQALNLAQKGHRERVTLVRFITKDNEESEEE